VDRPLPLRPLPGHRSPTHCTRLFPAGCEREPDTLTSSRTRGSRTPGHPEHGRTAGAETTTGPPGQSVAAMVGTATAGRHERGLFAPDTPDGASPSPVPPTRS